MRLGRVSRELHGSYAITLVLANVNKPKTGLAKTSSNTYRAIADMEDIKPVD